jgi:hypothetical protein
LGDFGRLGFFGDLLSGIVRGEKADGFFDELEWTTRRGPVLHFVHSQLIDINLFIFYKFHYLSA